MMTVADVLRLMQMEAEQRQREQLKLMRAHRHGTVREYTRVAAERARQRAEEMGEAQDRARGYDAS